ncbi:MAG: glycerol-3-phosphate dehydrogenase [Bacteroidales bacterium]|nr:glycerol-3-phosphate dehydrogenase [Bacteroidales bacterium]
MSYNIGIIGEGSWATAIAKVITDKKIHINWLIRFSDIRKAIKEKGKNPKYLSDVTLDTKYIKVKENLNELFNSSEIIFLILPSIYTEELFSSYNFNIQNKIIISGIKGILPKCMLTPSQFFNTKFNISYENIAFISGPSHAEEIAMEKLTFLTAFSSNKNLSDFIKKILECNYLKISYDEDIIGAEYATSLKNVIAIAVGTADSLGYGDNFISILVSNAMKEIKTFLDVIIPSPKRNIINYPYLGDLLVTCYSQFSRNRTFGVMLGKGYSVKAAQLEMNMIAEGYYAVKSIITIAEKYNISLPICNAVYLYTHKNHSPRVELRLLTNKLM